MKAKSGKAVKEVEPTAPDEAFAADEAKPGKAAKVKAEQIKNEQGKYGSTKSVAFKPAKSTSQSDDEKLSWIEIELIDNEDNPMSGERYEIKLPDGTTSKGTLDGKGFARVEGFEPGECEVSFPKLESDAWD